MIIKFRGKKYRITKAKEIITYTLMAIALFIFAFIFFSMLAEGKGL